MARARIEGTSPTTQWVIVLLALTHNHDHHVARFDARGHPGRNGGITTRPPLHVQRDIHKLRTRHALHAGRPCREPAKNPAVTASSGISTLRPSGISATRMRKRTGREWAGDALSVCVWSPLRFVGLPLCCALSPVSSRPKCTRSRSKPASVFSGHCYCSDAVCPDQK
ncbi:hypothetical protein FB451DRAFT_1188801 [Mycena latifolia]|nr:hypothetical protein FB451DRAFT_1188801 [Mycena latifolia]